jgi:hypothetical protein
MVAIRERPLWPPPGLPAAAWRHNGAAIAAASEASDATLTVDFEPPPPGRAGGGAVELGTAQRQAFCAALARERANVLDWFARHGWLPDCRPGLRIVVAPRFRISRSLVPAWDGQRGHMEFPAARAASGTAAIAHELVHVYFPNANRLLAEGLAIYAQAEIGSNPAFPNFGAPLHAQAHETLRQFPGPPAQILADLDAIATPNPLTLKVGDTFFGEDARGQGAVYRLAGSFAAFLIETRGLAAFRALYLRTPFVPGTSGAGRPQRWMQSYGLSLPDLEVEWKSAIACGDRASATPPARENSHA